ncbi:MAG: GFA family protein [Phaeospirillum sp.]|nr:GFA family protein [Phaeospirillum sp.]
MIEGSCLCGGIRYEYDGEIDEISICHCSQCRKAQGSAFVAVSPIASARFRLVSGAELLKEFRATPGKARAFCVNCGSPIYSAKDDLPEVKRLRLGTVDTHFVCSNIYHIFVGSKASWLDFNDTHPRFAERKP